MQNIKRTYRAVTVILVTGLILLSQFTPVKATPTSLDWGSFSASGLTTFGVYEADDINVLTTGDLAQLIWAGPDGLINPPQPDGTTSGDDIILDTALVNNGPPLPPPLFNKGYIPLKTYTFDTTDPQAGKDIYIRAWNSDSASTATAFGNSTTSTLSAGGTFNAPRWRMTHTPTAITLSAFSASSHGTSWWGVLLGISLVTVIVIAVYMVSRKKRISL